LLQTHFQLKAYHNQATEIPVSTYITIAVKLLKVGDCVEIHDKNNMTLSSLSTKAARRLSHSTKSVPMMEQITPRWLLSLLPWVPVDAGVYRVNKCKKLCDDPESQSEQCNEYGEKLIKMSSGHSGESQLPQTYPEYTEKPREYELSLIQTILNINTHVADIYNVPNNQFKEQIRLTVEAMLERQEYEIINNPDFGLVHSVAPSMRISTRNGPPTPDDLDELLSLVWKKPAFFLAHPRAIAAFGRECTRRGVPPPTVNLFGSPFITWRGVPIVPCDKLLINGKIRTLLPNGTTNILLMRVGEKEQGVIGLHQPGIPDEQYHPSLSVKFAGIDTHSVAHYILSLYFSAAVLTSDALGMLENVEVGNYYDYTD